MVLAMSSEMWTPGWYSCHQSMKESDGELSVDDAECMNNTRKHNLSTRDRGRGDPPTITVRHIRRTLDVQYAAILRVVRSSTAGAITTNVMSRSGSSCKSAL